jgi:hypothetical protein
MATLTTKFDLGQRVWKLRRTEEAVSLPCRFCRGNGWLPVTGGADEIDTVKCPRCYGKHVVKLAGIPQWEVDIRELVIGRIELRIHDNTSSRQPSGGGDNYDPQRHREDEETYMCWETGIGTGAVYGRSAGSEVYGSEEEAREAADERNEGALDGTTWKPTAEELAIALGFLDHHDVYVHDSSHIALARQLVAASRAA